MAALGTLALGSAALAAGGGGTSAPPVGGDADHLTITTQPGSGTSGVVLATQPVVEVRDVGESAVVGDTSTVVAGLVVVTGSGTLSGTTSVSAVDGVATFTDLKITGSGTFQLEFSDGALIGDTSASITITGVTPSPYLNVATDGADPGIDKDSFDLHVGVARDGDRRGVTRTLYVGTYEGASYPADYNDITEPVVTGTTHNVTDSASLSAAITAAVPGDEIVIAAGVANRITGNFTLPVKAGADGTPGGNGVITIRSSAVASLPYGLRVIGPNQAFERGVAATDPEFFGHVRTANINPVFSVAMGAAGWRLVGLYCDVDPAYDGTPNGNAVGRIIYVGDGGSVQNTVAETPQNIVVDRCIVRGHDDLHCRAGISMHADHSYVIDSCIENIHTVNEGDCQGFVTWNSTGVIALINTSIEASSECWAVGGANNAVGEQSDQEIRWIRTSKPVKWRSGDPTYIGFQWEIKNLGEVKHANRLLIEGVHARHSWTQAQNGYAFLIKNEYQNTLGGHTRDIILRHIDISGCAIGVSVNGGTYAPEAATIRRVVLDNFIIDDCGGSTWDPSSQYGEGLRFSATSDCKVIHGVVVPTRMWVDLLQVSVTDGGDGKNDNLEIRDTIFAVPVTYSFKGAGASEGGDSMALVAPGGTIHGCLLTAETSSQYTGGAYSGNYFPASESAIKMVDVANRDYTLVGSTQSGEARVATGLATQVAPGGGVSGTPLPQQPIIEIVDQFGDLISASGTITAEVVSGAATITAGGTAAAVDGVAEFSGLTLDCATQQDVVLRFTATGLTSVTVPAITVTITPVATALAVTQNPGPANSGDFLSPQPVVEVRDQNDALFSSNATVTATIIGGTGTIVGGGSVQAVGGVAEFTGLRLTVPATDDITIRFSATGLTPADAPAVTITLPVVIPPVPTATDDAITLAIVTAYQDRRRERQKRYGWRNRR